MADLITLTLYDPDGRRLDACETTWNETADDLAELLRLSGNFDAEHWWLGALEHIARVADRQLRAEYNDPRDVPSAELPEWYYVTMSVQT